MLRTDCITDIETMIQTLSNTKGYTELDIIDCMAHIVQSKCKVRQTDIFKENKIRHPKKIIEVPDEAQRLAKLFEELLTLRRKPAKPVDLSRGARILSEMNKNLSWVEIEWAIKYSQDPENCTDRYMPVIQSIPALVEKYDKLVNHKKRNDNFKMNRAFDDSLKEHEKYANESKKSRMVVYYSEYSNKFITYNETHTKCPFTPNIELDEFKNMTTNQKIEYFNIMTDQEKEAQKIRTKKAIEELKEKLL